MVRIIEESCGVYCGKQIGLRTVIGKPFSLGPGGISVVVQCQCGRIAVVACRALSKGQATRCRSCNKTTHGETIKQHVAGKPRLYNIWTNMKGRCLNPASDAYHNYGGRGITVCKEWEKHYDSFRQWAINSGYSDRLQIDRINNNGNYEPANCRWTTAKTNSSNRRNTINLFAFGEHKPLAEWSKDLRCVVSFGTLRKRVNAGWMPEEAMTTQSRSVLEHWPNRIYERVEKSNQRKVGDP